MFRKLEVWQESVNLIKEIYNITNKLPKSEEFNLKSQLKRAVVSVSQTLQREKVAQAQKILHIF